MTNRKLQVFISSPYRDLIPERQAIVEAVLSAGHIPTGMELFVAGSDSPLELIKKWISSSDVFLLLLGGRYGSLEPTSGKSYTQLEYEHALQLGKPFFSLVMDEELLLTKARSDPSAFLELEHRTPYLAFKELVCTRHVRFFKNLDDLKYRTVGALREINSSPNLVGWIREDTADSKTQLRSTLGRSFEVGSGLLRDIEEHHNYSIVMKSVIDEPGGCLRIGSPFLRYWFDVHDDNRMARLLRGTKNFRVSVLFFSNKGLPDYDAKHSTLIRKQLERTVETFPDRFEFKHLLRCSDLSYIVYEFHSEQKVKQSRCLVGYQNTRYIDRPFIEFVSNPDSLSPFVQSILWGHDQAFEVR
ncbi:MAG: DUF4062 domain-containing protein [Fimbriimonas sp.]|nr:DUF4062 domain-containing protein [Fimbriimonas sp.]